MTHHTKTTNRSLRFRAPAAFTLLEMVIVLGIIALLLGGAVAVVGPKILNSAKIHPGGRRPAAPSSRA